jgi:hypothetical protein
LFGAILLWAVVGIAAAIIMSSSPGGAREGYGAMVGFFFVGAIGGLVGLIGGSIFAWMYTSNPATASANAGKLWVGMVGTIVAAMIAYGVYNTIEAVKAQSEYPPLSQVYFELEIPEAAVKEGCLTEQLTITLMDIPARWDANSVVRADGKAFIQGEVPLVTNYAEDGPRWLEVTGPEERSWKFKVPIPVVREKAMTWSAWKDAEMRSEYESRTAAGMRYRVEFGPEVR